MKRSSSESQRSLLDVWSQKSCERKRKDAETTSLESTGGDLADVSEGELLTDSDSDTGISEDPSHQKSRLDLKSGAADRSCMCCNDDQQAYHPSEGIILAQFAKKGRRFLPAWYEKFPWVTLCTAQKKVFCVYCRYPCKHKLFKFCKKGDEAFSLKGFNNYKKAVEKFRIHENSDSFGS